MFYAQTFAKMLHCCIVALLLHCWLLNPCWR